MPHRESATGCCSTLRPQRAWGARHHRGSGLGMEPQRSRAHLAWCCVITTAGAREGARPNKTACSAIKAARGEARRATDAIIRAMRSCVSLHMHVSRSPRPRPCASRAPGCREDFALKVPRAVVAAPRRERKTKKRETRAWCIARDGRRLGRPEHSARRLQISIICRVPRRRSENMLVKQRK
jgi:hypothetical protein